MSIQRLAELAASRERVVVGLNSGTSMDGVDAICLQASGTGPGFEARPLAFLTLPYPAPLRARLGEAPEMTLEEASLLHVELGRAFARAARAIAHEAGLDMSGVDLVGSHGQTLFHRGTVGRGPLGATFQGGDADIIAEETGVITVGDFRSRDVAAGGAGAPLMPYLDWVLFRDRPRTVTVNLGGVASVTRVAAELEGCFAFDAGPCNLPLDWLAARLTKGNESFDPGGRLAAEGRVDPILLERLMAHPYVQEPPPKTTGREMFGHTFGEELLARHTHLALRDILATVCTFTARSIHEAVTRDLQVPGGPREIVVSGGGVCNHTLLRQLKRLFRPVPVTTLEAHGFDPHAKEALLFALLANERILGSASNVPACTGARWPVCLGKLAL